MTIRSFSIYKSELLYLDDYDDIDDFLSETDKYFEYYNTERISEKFNGLTPLEYMSQALNSTRLVSSSPDE